MSPRRIRRSWLRHEPGQDANHQLPRRRARGPARGPAARSARIPHGRGCWSLRRRLCLFQGPAGGIRRGTRARCAAVRVRLHRRRHRRRARRHASDRRGDDGQFQPAGDGPDPQQRRDLAPHVRRPVLGAAGDPHGDRRRPPTRRAAFAQSGMLVRAHPRHPRAGACHRGRCARHALDRVARSRSGGDLRTRRAIQRRGRSRRRGRTGRRASIAPPCAGREPT